MRDFLIIFISSEVDRQLVERVAVESVEVNLSAANQTRLSGVPGRMKGRRKVLFKTEIFTSQRVPQEICCPPDSAWAVSPSLSTLERS